MESISEQLKKNRILQGTVHCREYFVSSWSQSQRIYVLVSNLQIHRKMVTAGTN